MSQWLFTLQLQISLAVIVILLFRQAMKKLPKIYSYLLWLLVFARLLVPVSVETRFSFMPSEQEQEIFAEQVLESLGEVNKNVVGSPEEQTPDFTREPMMGTDNSQMQPAIGSQPASSENTEDSMGVGMVDGSIVAGTDAFGNQEDVFVTPMAGESTSAENRGAEVTDIIFLIVWGMGMAAVLGINAVALRRVRKLLGNVENACGTELPQSVTIANFITGKKKSIPIYFCGNINTPFTLGLLKPAIYLPAGLSEEEQEYILCHEQVHISRKDNLVKHVAFLLTAVYWFNPFVWVAFFFMEQDMEMSCDEKVLKIMGRNIKRDYSQSLLNFAEGKGKMPATHLTFGENSVKQRVKNVLSYKNAKKWTIGIGALVLVVVVVVLFTTGQEDAAGRGDSVQGSIVQGDEVQADGQGGPTQGEDEPVDNQGDPAQDVKSEDDAQQQAYPTPQLALEAWIADFMDENSEVTYGSHYYVREEATATITYSVLGFPDRYLMKEAVSVTEKNGTYSVDSRKLTSYDVIDSKKQYDEIYWREVSNCYWWSELGYNDSFYRRVLQMLHSDVAADVEYAKKFTDPVTAAVELLNLGEGVGVVADTSAMAYPLAEGSEVTVVYTFAKDNSVVEIPMELGEGVSRIWGLQGMVGRIVYNIRQVADDPNDVIQLTSYGFYRRKNDELTCLYPYYVNPQNSFTIQDGILYFVVDSGYWEGSLEYQEDAICMLNLATGEVDKNTLQLGEMNRTSAPIKGINVHDGYVVVTCNGNDYPIPLVNTGQTGLTTEYTYNGKPVIELTEEEQDAYGVLIRQQLLNHPGQILKLSNRTLKETFALIDLDGDNRTEKISMTIKSISYVDHYQFRIGDSVIEDRGDYISNDIWAFSLDGKEIVLAIYDDGPSGDPQTMLFLYRNGEIKRAGEFYEHIGYITVEDGIIHADEFAHVIQTDGIERQYIMNADGEIDLIEQEAYDFIGLNDIQLLVELPLRDTPEGEIVVNMKPQTVHFLKTDKTFEWVYVEGEDGTGGWFHVENFGRITELKMDSMEVFEGLSMAG